MVTVGYVEFLIRGLKGTQTFNLFFSVHKINQTPLKKTNWPVTISVARLLVSGIVSLKYFKKERKRRPFLLSQKQHLLTFF